MEKENKERLVKIIIGGTLLAAAFIISKVWELKTWQELLIFLPAYLIAGGETLLEAGEKLFKGELLDEDFLMSVATLGAMSIGFLPGAESQFPEAVFVMLFFQVGELFEDMAEDRSRKSIQALMDIRPDTANVERDGKVETVNSSEISVGETIVIKPGERVPLDGTVLEGSSSIDTVALTGESVPRKIGTGDDALSGCVNLTGVLRVRVTKPFGETTASKILELVENASESKSRSESLITRFAKVYTPIVVAAAVVLAILPPLFSGDFGGSFPKWLYRALTFLIVSCPCALVISIPLAFFGGIGGAARKGILVKGSNHLESLARLGTVVLDKTGTLTEGVFEVTAVHPENISGDELSHLAAHVERYSPHPLAVSLRKAYPGEADGCSVEDVEEIPGHGVRATVNGRRACVGDSAMMESSGSAWKDCEKKGTIVHVSLDGEYVGHIVVSDRIKEDAAKAVAELRRNGVSRTVMLTGDKEDVAADVAAAVGVDEYRSGLLPAGKVAEVERLLREKPEGRTLAFVGDGINDAPALARADVGIAMGALGSDAAIEAADVVIMDDRTSRLAEGVRTARRTIRIAGQNTVFSISVKVLVLLLATGGLASMWMAVLSDVGVMVLATLNSARALRA
ncbi:MAG: cadmium-translocating P-type ATPase [Bacteroidales bacterium]|nr:cadmium-translocating P-type ATPase [Bacteroidales bacterium]